MRRIAFRRLDRSLSSAVGLLAILFAAGSAILAFSSCAGRESPSVAMKREQLFSLGYGPAEDQLDLFQMDRAQSTQKTCLTMREGIFYIANGAGGKVVRYSSFGDPLSMIYNAAKNPEPIVLKAVSEKPGQGAAASSNASEAEGLGKMICIEEPVTGKLVMASHLPRSAEPWTWTFVPVKPLTVSAMVPSGPNWSGPRKSWTANGC